MEFKILNSSELQWELNFHPTEPWPEIIPVIACKWENGFKVIAGFDRMGQNHLPTIILARGPWITFNRYWQEIPLRPIERIRFENKVGIDIKGQHILAWPLEFQIYLDGRQIPLKNLHPLEYLQPWMGELVPVFLTSSFTASEVREIIELLCDLKLTGFTWEQVYVKENWLGHLKRIRFPKTYQADLTREEKVQEIPWPRGIRAKWERQGDTAGISIQTKVTTPLEWDRLRDVISRLEIKRDLWDL